MKGNKVVVAYTICACMLTCLCPMSVNAQEYTDGIVAEEVIEESTEEVTAEEMEKATVEETEEVTVEEVETDDSIESEENSISWEIVDGTLTISGTGAMEDYYSDSIVPWNDYKDSIISIIVEEGITELGNYAFTACNNLTDVTLPNSLNDIGKGTFQYCYSLKNITIPESITIIDDYVFSECTGLCNIVIPGNVESIGLDAFYNCTGLKSVYLAEGVKTVKQNAFLGCINLDEIHFPESLIRIDYCAFGDIRSAEKSTAWLESQEDGVVYAGQVLYKYKGTMPANTIIQVEEGTKGIANSAFWGLENTGTMMGNCVNLKEIHIPDSVEYIGSMAFAYNSFESVYFYGDAPEFSGDSFEGVETDVYYPGYNATWTLDKLQNYCGVLKWKPQTINSDENIDIEVVLQPENQFVLTGTKAVFSVEANGNNLSYQWQYTDDNGTTWNNSESEGNITNQLYVEAEEENNGRIYRCLITNSVGDSLSTNIAALYVVETPIEITRQPSNIYTTEGITEFYVQAKGSSLKYQWQYSNNNGKYWYNSGMEGNNTATLYVKATLARSGQLYRCIITDAYGYQVTSSEVFMNVEKAQLSIWMHPENQMVENGKVASFFVQATGYNLKYQWQYSNDNGTYWHDSGMEGNDTYALSVNATTKRNGQMYRCIVTDGYGEEIITDTAVLEVEMQALEILSQPESKTAAVGENVIFLVEAEGEDLTYQWQYSNNNGTYWYNSGMTGNDTNSLTVPVTEKRDGQIYRCVITDKYEEKVITNEVSLNIEYKDIEILSQPQNQTAAIGDIAIFAVEAEGEGLTYQWQYSNSNGEYWYNSGMTGNTTNQLSVNATAKRNGQMYRCVIKDEIGNKIITDAVILTVN